MELARLPELGPFSSKLSDAGVSDVESLASWADIDGLSARTGIGAERLESFRDAAREAIGRALVEAGVGDGGALATADLEDVARRTGIGLVHLQQFRNAAGGGAPGTPAVPDAVLLLEGRDARVTVEGRVYDAVPLVTARAHEDPGAIASRIDGPFVLLKEQAATAFVRVDARTFDALPLYKARDGREVRIRVAEILEKTEPAAPVTETPKKKGFLGRFGKK